MHYCIRVYLAIDWQENKLIMCTFCLLYVVKKQETLPPRKIRKYIQTTVIIHSENTLEGC
jgi:hypothetical protein